MKEKIILASNINESETLRTIAKHSQNSFGTRILNSVELAKIALNHCGISITQEFLPKGEEAYAIFPILKTIDYFKNITLDDARDVVNTIRTIRNLNSKVKLNEAIFEACDKFLQWQFENNLINCESIIIKAIKEAKTFNAEFYYLKEFPITPLEKKLLSQISNRNFKEISFSELANTENHVEQDIEYTKAYGSNNEIENIISHIYKNNIPLDKCLIACTNTKMYSQLIYDTCKTYNIPVSFSCGIPISNSHPAQLLKLLNNWNSFGVHGIDSLREIITSTSFNQKLLADILEIKSLDQDTIEGICKVMGNLRISFDAKTNKQRLDAYTKLLTKQLSDAQATRSKEEYWLKKDYAYLQMASKFSDEFNHGLLYFIDKFSVIRNSEDQKLDIAAKNAIIEGIKTFNKYFPTVSVSEIIPKIIQTSICHEISKEGALHVCALNSAISACRENVFICGMQANDFPGKPTENYLISDDKLMHLSNDENLPTSDNIIKQKKESFFNLIENAQKFGSKISISFSGNDLVEIKEQNPSSVLFELYEKSHPNSRVDDFNSQVKNLEFFDGSISLSKNIGRAYSNNEKVVSKIDNYFKAKETDEKLLNKNWSPSSIETYLNCPRQFYLKYIEGIADISPDNPNEVLNAMVLGNLAHKLMEFLANSSPTEEEFLTKADELFEEELIARPPIDKKDAQREKNKFLYMMKTAYKQDPKNKVEAIEKWIKATHSSGLNIGGFFDRLEIENGQYKIIDFKTKKKVEHVENDIDTCLQIALYLWLCEQNNINASVGEYRYLRFGTSVNCNYSDNIKAELDEKINDFTNALKTADYPRSDDKNACKYCNYARLCNWKEKDADE